MRLFHKTLSCGCCSGNRRIFPAEVFVQVSRAFRRYIQLDDVTESGRDLLTYTEMCRWNFQSDRRQASSWHPAVSVGF